ncbi:ACT domain-containing protein [Amycolatopsis sp. lyj-23]|uniref:ACT domain-containing protein n=1 Tax=Amycolatopsis sp. lyj-23 TaxID=2789283 RepID=UPI003978F890
MAKDLARQQLRVLPEHYEIRFVPNGSAPPAPDAPWTAMVRAPEGLTVIREADPDAVEQWRGLYGDDPHGLDLPGMLAAVVGPLGEAAIPVFVTSTFHCDLVLVPVERLDEAVTTLRDAGHTIR